MTIVHSAQGSRIVVAINGDLDMKTAGPLREALDQLIDRYRDKHLVIDLAEVDFIDSSGLGVLLGRYKKLAAEDRSLSLVGVRPSVKAVLALTGMLAIIPVAESAPRPGKF